MPDHGCSHLGRGSEYSSIFPGGQKKGGGGRFPFAPSCRARDGVLPTFLRITGLQDVWRYTHSRVGIIIFFPTCTSRGSRGPG